jgi:hypothetical protein
VQSVDFRDYHESVYEMWIPIGALDCTNDYYLIDVCSNSPHAPRFARYAAVQHRLAWQHLFDCRPTVGVFVHDNPITHKDAFLVFSFEATTQRCHQTLTSHQYLIQATSVGEDYSSPILYQPGTSFRA